MEPWRPLPDEFAQLVLRALEPADAEEAAALIARAAELDDAELAFVLDAFADRVRSSPDPVRASELRAWLDATPPAV